MRESELASASAFLTFALFLLTSALPSAQLPPRDNAAAPRVGTATISGVVVTDEAAGRPLRRATVTLGSGSLQLPQSVVTDDAGAFAFADLAPGNYTLAVSKPGYVLTYYGATKPGRGSGVPIAVLDGQHVTGLKVAVLHGSVMTGFVRYDNGQIAPQISIQVMQVGVGADGKRSLTPVANQAATDDRGVYRVFGLPPGDYLVSAAGATAVLPSEVRRVTPAEVQWAEQAAAVSQPAPGASAAPLPPAPEPGQTVTYASVYFPGTPVMADAGIVTVGPNEERSGVDFSIPLVPTARITGIVVDPDGRPPQGTQLSLVPAQAESPTDFLGMLIGRAQSRTMPDGSFTLSGVAPGHYTLIARGAPASDASASGAQTAMAASPLTGLLIGRGGAASTLWAMEDLVIDGRDVSGLTLRLQPGMTVSGRIVFDAAGTHPPPSFTSIQLSLMTQPTGASPLELAASMLVGVTPATVAADGTFTARGVTPNTYRITLLGPGLLLNQAAPLGGWSLKSIAWHGRDLADLPFEIKPGDDLTGLVVTLTDRQTELSGTVFDQAGRPAPGFPIVVFSTDRAYWSLGSRRVQQARPASDGTFKVTGLPAGEYYVAAALDFEPADLYNPAFLEQLVPAAFKIALADGEKKTQNLKLGR